MLRDDKSLYELWNRRRFRQRFVLLPIAAIVYLTYWTRAHPGAAIGGIGPHGINAFIVALLTFTVVYSLLNWRCPSCNRYLGKYQPRHCPHCDFQLRR